MNDPDFLTHKNEWLRIFQELEIPCTVDYNPNPPGAERILVLCRGGNTRSVAVAMLLKYKYMKNVLVASIEKNGQETISMLLRWTTHGRVIVTEPEHADILMEWFPQIPSFTAFIVDLGKHRRLVCNPFDLDLLKEIDRKLPEVFKNAKRPER